MSIQLHVRLCCGRLYYIRMIVYAPATSRRSCQNSPDFFCYICGSFTIPSQRTNISTFVKQEYTASFKIKLSDHGRAWAPQKECKQRFESLRMWTKGTLDKLPFGVPMVWRKLKDHCTVCYFYLLKISGYNKKNKWKMEYPSLPSAIRPVPHSAETPVPFFAQLPCLEDVFVYYLLFNIQI